MNRVLSLPAASVYYMPSITKGTKPPPISGYRNASEAYGLPASITSLRFAAGLDQAIMANPLKIGLPAPKSISGTHSSAYYSDYSALALRWLVFYGTSEEKKTLGLVLKHGRKPPPIYAIANLPWWYLGESFPGGYIAPGVPLLSDYIHFIENQETLLSAINAYPWPGPKNLVLKALIESFNGEIHKFISRKDGPRSMEARSLITIGMVKHWDVIVDRIQALAEHVEKRKKRRAVARGAALGAMALMSAGVLSGVALAVAGAAVSTLGAIEKAQAAKGMAEFAAEFETSQPAFAAEIERVSKELGIGPDQAAGQTTLVEGQVPGGMTLPGANITVMSEPPKGSNIGIIAGVAALALAIFFKR